MPPMSVVLPLVKSLDANNDGKISYLEFSSHFKNLDVDHWGQDAAPVQIHLALDILPTSMVVMWMANTTRNARSCLAFFFLFIAVCVADGTVQYGHSPSFGSAVTSNYKTYSYVQLHHRALLSLADCIAW